MSSTSTFDTWVSWRSPNPQASLRLFCFPYAGGAALTFRTWPDSLPIAIEICPVELPGRGKRITSAPFTRLQLLVQAITIALLPYLDKPFAFFGHNMGGLVSFELARILRKKYGKSPALHNRGMICINCQSNKVCKNGHRRGKQNYLCRDCGKQFLEFYSPKG